MKKQLIDSHNRIQGFIHNTPVFTSAYFDGITNANLYFKCENFQKMGAFKIRGALNAVMQLSDDRKAKGVVTHSSGNFAQALSLAAKMMGVKAYIVMPENAPQVKKDAVKGYHGQLIECGPTLADRQAAAERIGRETGAAFIHPSDNLNVILGQATAAKELLTDRPGLDYIFVPIGGGGLAAGTILSANHFGSCCKVVGGEPSNVDDAYRSLLSGKIENNTNVDTMADGLKTCLGDINFPIIKENISKIVRVEEVEIAEAMQSIWERMKVVVEASAAVALAALIKEKEPYKNKKVGIILSGGNVDFRQLRLL